MVMPNCAHLLQSPSIKEFIVFSGSASKPEQNEIEIGNISCEIQSEKNPEQKKRHLKLLIMFDKPQLSHVSRQGSVLQMLK